MKRILIIGCPGTGKSTFSKQLTKQLCLPLVYLDHLHWLPGNIARPDEEFEQLVQKACEQSAWIMDGNYSRHLHLRLPYADTVIFLDRPRWLCLWRITTRWLKSFFETESFAPGCKQIFLDGEMIKWVWHWHRQYYAYNLDLISKHPHTQLIILHNQQEIDAFLEEAKRKTP